MGFLNMEVVSRIQANSNAFFVDGVPRLVTISKKELGYRQDKSEYYKFTVKRLDNGKERVMVDDQLFNLIAANNDAIDEYTVFEVVPKKNGKTRQYTDKNGETRTADEFDYSWKIRDANDAFHEAKKTQKGDGFSSEELSAMGI